MSTGYKTIRESVRGPRARCAESVADPAEVAWDAMATKQYLASDCSDLLSLRNVLKRDPAAYEAEFTQQLAHFHSLVSVHGLSAVDDIAGDIPEHTSAARAQLQEDRHFSDVCGFVSHCLPLFRDNPAFASHVTSVPAALCNMLQTRAASISPILRKALVQAITLLRNRGIQSSIALMPILFCLFEVPDKALRVLVFGDIVATIAKIESTGTSAQKRAHQRFVFDVISSSAHSEFQSLKALGIAIELFRKNAWRDAKTANVIAEAVFSSRSKISTGALRFLLCDAFTDDDDEDNEEYRTAVVREAMKSIRENATGAKVSTNKKKHERAMERAKNKMKKAEAKSALGPTIEQGPITLIYDPQGFAERLFSKLRASKDPFSVRQLQMNVISRLVNEHNLMLLNLYSFLQRYLNAHVKNVTAVMSFLVQSCHSKVPPDVLEPIVKAIADQFVSDRSSPESMAVGLNCIRGICARQPLAMSGELLQDLVLYKSHRDKGVIMAARSLLSLYREINPMLLDKKDRGRPNGLPQQAPLDFGEEQVATDVPGAHLLRLQDDEDEQAGSSDEWSVDEDVPMTDSDADESDQEDDDEEPPMLVDEDEAAALREMVAAGLEMQKQATVPLGAVEILTPKDFERLEAMRKQEVAAGLSSKRRSREEGHTVDPMELEASTKQKRRRLEERIELMKANKEERKAMFAPGGKKGGNSATNEEKNRKKPFMLTKFSKSLQKKRTDSQLSKRTRRAIHSTKARKSAQNTHRRKHRRF
ncbi:unnamed protein product (mitochondrion) [Plasmodiophora brassicae]|uniref:Protein SDA1 n=1 Tax=Plasmodiophora brassicae TaxID=37360 RepID=A0A0G4IQ77_PLABS|nr:hypothetical protein PBRA_000651 [Plasmodiophora brassicae]SPQ97613.1 unnamed protein product [Plasmodiophora brassicae]